MTRKRLRNIIKIVTAIYLLCVLTGVTLRIFDVTEEQKIYSTFKDLLPLIFAVPLGYLGFCFQRRNSFMSSLKFLWKNMIAAVNEAIQYTHREENSQEDFGAVLTSLSEVIDELRGVYKNIGETESNIGRYPFEPIKTINEEIKKLGYGKIENSIREKSRDLIIGNWQSIRKEFLHEFDRYEPTKPVTSYKID